MERTTPIRANESVNEKPVKEPQKSEGESFFERFHIYFQREIAQLAADPLAASAQIEFRIKSSEGKTLETFTFSRKHGTNQLEKGPASDPQIVFTMPALAAEEILSDPSQEIGTIGVNILKLVVTSDPQRRISLNLKAGFLTLFSKGYFGVLTQGGSAIFSYLATKGLNGMSAIKSAVKKMKER